MIARETRTWRDSLTVVRCRPGAVGWFCVSLLAGLGALLIAVCALPSKQASPYSLSDAIYLLTMTGLLLGGAFALALYQLRAQVVADDVGLRWRGLRGWKEARWDDVSDFYDKYLQQGTHASVIVTPAGTITLTDAGWNRLEVLRDFVARRATRACCRFWAERGKRDNEPWPLVFDYNTADNRWMPRLLTICGLTFIVCWAGMYVPVIQRFPRNIAEMGWAWTLGAFATSALVMILIPVLLILLYVPILRNVVCRREHKFIVTPDSLTFEDGERRIVTPWQDITLVSAERKSGLQMASRLIIESRQGTFDFVHPLRDSGLLRLLIARFAPEAVARGASEQPDINDLLAGKLAVQPGERIYHYRTRTSRAMLWLPTTYAVAGILMAYLTHLGLTEAREIVTPIILTALFGGLTLWAYWRYRAASISTDRQGITQYGLFGKRSIDWGDIQDYYMSGGDILTFGNVIGSRTRVRFWRGIANIEELMTEIQRRAVRSRTKEWNRPGTPVKRERLR